MKFFDSIISLFLSIVIANFIVASSLLIAAKISWTLAVVSSVLLGLLTLVCSIFLKKWFLSWTALIAVIASLLCGMYISDYTDLRGREIVRNITIKEAVKYPQAAGYTFTDGFVNTDLKTTYQKIRTSRTGPTTITYYYAAPVVDRDWDLSKPVSVFAVRAIADDTRNWSSLFRAGIRAPASSYNELELAVKKCILEHSLKHIVNPIMINWVRSPEKAIATYEEDLFDTLTIWNIILVLGFLIFRIIYYLKQRKKIPEEQEKITGVTGYRIFFSFYTFYILIFSLHFAQYDFSQPMPVILLVISLIVYIIAISALQVAHSKEERSSLDLVYLVLYPYVAHFLIFLKLDFGDSSLWLFCGFFYFFIIVGGFVFGIVFSPLIARRNLRYERETNNHMDKGKGIAKMGKFMLIFFIFLGGIFATLTIIFLQLIKTVQNLEYYQVGIFYLLLFLGIGAIIKFTYRHTVFNINEDSTLKRKYKPAQN